ncbi:MAG TPA: hypothetical protein DDW76_34210 [Cyanobacteria bacterium UBA11369]|nr:hypothetical protein [Cyanobacteria bacterium UBA11371]HBE32406.1 hypothetical protein [Cyanobacteria bacterium UBA11368]HBE53669.1 hypothetical protein [Cyanobacteria bacterium UBA11369]
MINPIGPLAWVWLIIIGGLMITPGGIYCIVCGPIISRVIGVISILIGIAGFAVSLRQKSVNS